MRYRNLGETGLKVSELLLGGAHIGAGDIDRDVTSALFRAGLDAGINSFYTADAYGRGVAQELTGEALKGVPREEFVLIDRIGAGLRPGPILTDADFIDEETADHAALQREGLLPTMHGLSRKHLVHAMDKSLERLQVDYVDCVFVHIWDPTVPLEETLETLDGFVRAGKALHVGTAHGWAAWQVHWAHRISEARGFAKIRGFQTEYNLLNRWPEREQLPACAAGGVGVLAFNALAGNLLAGELDVERLKALAGPGLARVMHATDYDTDECRARAAELIALARECGRRPAELAQGWVLSRPAVAGVNIGPNTPEELGEMVRVVDDPLTPEEIALVESRVAMDAPPDGSVRSPVWNLMPSR